MYFDTQTRKKKKTHDHFSFQTHRNANVKMYYVANFGKKQITLLITKRPLAAGGR